ncbi:hypothetical protein HPB50_002248 [Hyalomma asiaticum]|uniref:Uncharacterized protein n=1 Tax=Hyalomma asiaticum TaxID=266040 RepID=A0ACB7TDI3_HYAAI|nr:hypothetical protein HPB50_002248 [Hyalomma asiaticum]
MMIEGGTTAPDLPSWGLSRVRWPQWAVTAPRDGHPQRGVGERARRRLANGGAVTASTGVATTASIHQAPEVTDEHHRFSMPTGGAPQPRHSGARTAHWRRREWTARESRARQSECGLRQRSPPLPMARNESTPRLASTGNDFCRAHPPKRLATH